RGILHQNARAGSSLRALREPPDEFHPVVARRGAAAADIALLDRAQANATKVPELAPSNHVLEHLLAHAALDAPVQERLAERQIESPAHDRRAGTDLPAEPPPSPDGQQQQRIEQLIAPGLEGDGAVDVHEPLVVELDGDATLRAEPPQPREQFFRG